MRKCKFCGKNIINPQHGIRDFCDEEHKIGYRLKYMKNLVKSKRSGICLSNPSKKCVEEATPQNVSKSTPTAKPLQKGIKTGSRTNKEFLCLWCYFSTKDRAILYKHLEEKHNDHRHRFYKYTNPLTIMRLRTKANESIKEGIGISFHNPEDGNFYCISRFTWND